MRRRMSPTVIHSKAKLELQPEWEVRKQRTVGNNTCRHLRCIYFFRLFHLLDLNVNNSVTFKVTCVEFCSLDVNQRMLSVQYPPTVTEKDTAVNIVRVCVRVGILVVQSMVPSPNKNAVLPRHCLSNGQKDFQRQLRSVRSVRPKPMSSSRYTQSWKDCNEETCNIKNILWGQGISDIHVGLTPSLCLDAGRLAKHPIKSKKVDKVSDHKENYVTRN